MPSSEKNASFYVVFLSCIEPFSSFLLFTISMVLLTDIFYRCLSIFFPLYAYFAKVSQMNTFAEQKTSVTCTDKLCMSHNTAG